MKDVEPRFRTRLERVITPSERVIAVVTRHWMHMAAPVTVFTAATGFLIAMLIVQVPFLVALAWSIWLLDGIVTLWYLLSWWQFECFVITDKRFVLLSGVLVQRVAAMPLSKVTDMTVETTPLGRMLGYGSFVLESAGQNQAMDRVDMLPGIHDLYQAVNRQLYGGDKQRNTTFRPDMFKPASGK